MHPRIALTFGLLLAAAPVAGQGIGVAPHVGTLGIGADVAVGGRSALTVRAGANLMPLDISGSASDIDYTISPPPTAFTLFLDVAAPVGIRLTGGAVLSPGDIEAVGEFTGSVTIGPTTYTSADVGTLTGAIVNKDLSPYLGIGWGKPASSRLGFFLDLGVAFHGKPLVTLAADGPLSTNAQFQADLEAERQSMEDDLDPFRVYPVLSVGISFGLSRR